MFEISAGAIKKIKTKTNILGERECSGIKRLLLRQHRTFKLY